MKKFTLLKSVLVCCAAAAFISCTTEVVEEQYINLSDMYCSFQADAGQAAEVKVKTSPSSWEVEAGATWLKAEKTDHNVISIRVVEQNDTGSTREAVITVKAGNAVKEIKVNQLAKDDPFARYRILDTFQFQAAISPSGIYTGGFYVTLAPDDGFVFHPTVINLRTGERIEHDPVPQSVHDLYQTMCISDQGTLFIVDGQNGGTVMCTIDGDISKVATPDGFRFQPTIQGTSADGKYWVGFANDKSLDDGGMTYPLLWTDGEPSKLPMPELNYRDEEIWSGVMARGISANGEVIYGTSWENSDFGMLYWQDGKVEWVGKDVREVTPVVMEMADGTTFETHLCNGMICQADLTRISPSGRWIATSYRTETLAENRQAVVYEQYPAFYNTETETSIILEDYPTSTGCHVTDDGIAFIGIGNLGISTGRVYNLNTGVDLGTTVEWALEKYGIHIGDGYVNYMSADGEILFGTCLRTGGVGGLNFPSWYVAPALEK